MIETIIEVLIIAGTLVCASLQMRKDALKARRVYAIAFVLMIAVCIAFGIAQGAVAAGIFYTTLSFSPIEVLSLLAVIYWISLITEKGKMFNKVSENEIAKPAEPVNGKMNGLRPPLTAPTVFADRQLRGDSKKCCRPLLS